jgi:nicotinamide riboside kinase
MIENIEREYCFVFDETLNTLKFYLFQDKIPEQVDNICDYYIGKNKRIRIINNGKPHLEHKIGDKNSLNRIEKSEEISEYVMQVLLESCDLTVKKQRYTYLKNGVKYSFDYVSHPMRIGFFEVEFTNVSQVDQIFSFIPKGLKPCNEGAYKFFKRKIGICGAPSSGKSETAKNLSFVLNTKYEANSFHVTEYATTFLQKYNRLPTVSDQLFIFDGQLNRELNASKANIVISDCPVFLSYVYLTHINKDELNNNNAFMLSKLYKKSLFASLGYTDIIFLELIEYRDNGIRYNSSKEALEIQNKIKNFLDYNNINYMSSTYRDFNKIVDSLLNINHFQA